MIKSNSVKKITLYFLFLTFLLSPILATFNININNANYKKGQDYWTICLPIDQSQGSGSILGNSGLNFGSMSGSTSMPGLGSNSIKFGSNYGSNMISNLGLISNPNSLALSNLNNMNLNYGSGSGSVIFMNSNLNSNFGKNNRFSSGYGSSSGISTTNLNSNSGSSSSSSSSSISSGSSSSSSSNSGNYTITFQNLPQGWKTQNGNLLVPIAATKGSNNYFINMIAKSNKGQQIQRSLLFKFSGSGLFLSEYKYTINFNSLSKPMSSGCYLKSSNFLSNIIGGKSQSDDKDKINGNLKTVQTSTKIINLPSSSQLDKVVESSDITLITNTFQTVFSSNLDCQSKLTYLSDFLAKIQTFISIKKYRITDLQNSFTSAQSQLISLQNKLKTYQDEINGLNLTDLKVQLNTLVQKLQVAYNDYNNFNGPQKLDIQSKLKATQTEINNLQNQINQTKTQINTDKKNLQNIDSLIADLEAKILKAKNQKEPINNRINQAQKFITTSQNRINDAQSQIKQIQIKIKKTAQEKEKLKIVYTDLQKQVDTLKNKINLSEKRSNELNGLINTVNQQIKAQQMKLDKTEIIKLNQTIASLNTLITNIKVKINQLQLQCTGVTNAKPQVNSNQTITPLNQDQIKIYFIGRFSSNIFNNFISIQGNRWNTNKRMNLYSYNMFSNEWSKLYGNVYQRDIKNAYLGGLMTKFSFESDFQCSSNSNNNLNSMYGKINKISGNTIQVTCEKGNTYELQLGACSSINGISESLPSVGSNIAWKGYCKNGNKYQVQAASCY